MGEASEARPAKGWLRLLIESVDVPLDQKDPHRLLFSTVQSLIPGAHGLYYRGADGARKALAFDGAGNVNAPDAGWEQENIFVHLAHGHRPGIFGCGGVVRSAHSSGDVSESSPPASPLDAYTTATDRFEKTVSLVQKMMTASSIRSPRKTSRATVSHDSSEEDTTSKRYKEENDALKKRVNELEIELSSAQESLEEVKSDESHEMSMLRESAACAEARLDEAERMAESATRRACEADHNCDLERSRADKAEWSLGEHRSWLTESTIRVAELEDHLKSAHEERTRQQSRADKAEWTLGEHVNWLEQAKQRSEQLERALSSAQDQIADLKGRAERAEMNCEEQTKILADEREKTRAITEAADSATTALREKMATFEEELCHRAPPVIPPEHAECDTTFTSGSHSEVEEDKEEDEIEEEIQLASVTLLQAAPPSPGQDTVEQLELRVCELETALEESRKAVEAEFEARLAEVSQKAAESLSEVIAAKKRMEEESAAEVITKIQELTEKEDELNNLHSVIEDLREKLKGLERARADAEWHLGEHRDWLKNERDKVAYLEEQLRRVSAGESTTSRPVSRKNSTESGFGGSTVAAGNDSGEERKGSESPPAPAMMASSATRKMKFTAAPDDLAAELMALSKDKQRMAVEIRELKSRPDPSVIEAERRSFADTIQANNERCARLEAETAHFKDVAARVNMDTFNEKDGRISELEKIRANLEWSIGEKNQEINDAKWRIGELEGQCAQLRTSPISSEALEAKEREMRHIRDEKAHVQQQLDNARWRLGELEAECSRLHHCNSSEKEELERLRKESNDQKWRIGELESGYAHHEWLLGQAPSHDEMNALRNENSSMGQQLTEARRAADDAKWRVGELESELNTLQQRPTTNTGEVNELRAQKDQLQKEWNDQKWRIGELEAGYAHHEWIIDELRKKERREDGSSLHERELEWKLGETERECDTMRGRITHLECELGRRDAAAAAERPGQLEESLRALRAEKDNLDRRVRELDQMYHDTKWRNGELEAGLAHTKWLLEEEKMRVTRLEDCSAEASRDGSFVVRHRRPGDARLWQLAMRTSKDDTSELRAVTLAIDEPRDTDAVFLIGSFSSWECCARLVRRSPTSGRRELTVYLPRGRHEFRFIVEGGWASSSSYPTVPNPFGTTNNWITVE